jgi:ubiquinone/menaquinone biosynthesis C-methylase UbiE
MKNKPDALLNKPDFLPEDSETAQKLQDANKSFWEDNPMRYDWKDEVGHEEFSKPFFDEIDKRFFENVAEFMPWKKIPFDNLIPFDALKKAKVLEIGVGNGSHAQLLATNTGDFTGIDLTEYAQNSTAKRLAAAGLKGTILRMDAEKLEFPDNSFDFVWSWGVIHHSSNTSTILDEIKRVLKPGGKTTIMVYHRGWWNYYICGFIYHGLVQGHFFKTWSLHKTVQTVGDGALARFYTPTTWTNLIDNRLEINKIEVKGSKSEVFPLPGGKIKSFLMKLMPNSVSSFMTNKLRMGSFLISHMEKKA